VRQNIVDRAICTKPRGDESADQFRMYLGFYQISSRGRKFPPGSHDFKSLPSQTKNALPFPVTHGVPSTLSRRFADKPSKWWLPDRRPYRGSETGSGPSASPAPVPTENSV